MPSTRQKNYFRSLIFIFTLLVGNLAYANVVDKTGQVLSDSAITTKVKLSLAKESALKAFNIHVTTTHGVVILSGSVKTDAEFEKAVSIANSIRGVKAVNAENLKIEEGKQPIKDLLIKAQIEGLLFKDSVLNNGKSKFIGIGVNVKGGIVTLSGEVKSHEIKQHILKLVKSVKGVQRINDNLEVK